MRSLLVFFLALPMIITGLTNKIDIAPNPEVKVDKIEVTFERGMDLQTLADLQQSLASQEITLKYTYLEFDTNGLSGMGFTVDFKDNFHGAADTKHLPYSGRFGFLRDYREGAKISLQVGDLDAKLRD